MPKPDSQTLANVTALLMAGSHSDHITVDKIPYYMGIASAICKQAVAAMPEAGDAPAEVVPPEPPAPPAPVAQPPVVDIQKLIEESIALAFQKFAAPPPPVVQP